MVDKITINPLDVRGAGDIVSPKTLTDFGFYKAYIREETGTIQGLPQSIFTNGVRSQESLELTFNKFVDYNEELTNFPVTATLRYEGGSPAVGKTLTCTVNGNIELTGVTNSRGQVVFNVPVSYEGAYNGVISYNVHASGAVGGVTRRFKVYVGELNSILLTGSSDRTGVGGETTLICNVDCVMDDLVVPADGVPVSFFEEFVYSFIRVMGSHLCVTTGNTLALMAKVGDVDGSGIPDQTVKFFEEWEAGDLILRMDTVVKSGDTLEVSARLSDIDGSGISGETVMFYEEYEPVKLSASVSSGLVQTGDSVALAAMVKDLDGSRVQVADVPVNFYTVYELENIDMMASTDIVVNNVKSVLSAKVTDNLGTPVPDVPVSFFEEFTRTRIGLTGDNQVIVSGDNTVLSATVHDVDSLIRDVRVEFSEDFDSTDWSIGLTGTEQVIRSDDLVEVSATVLDDEDSPVSDVYVRFLADMTEEEIIVPESDVEPVVVDSVTFTASPSTVTYGSAVSLSATVKDQNGDVMVGETVTFKDGSTTIGTASTNSNGVASLSKSDLSVGSHTLTAVAGEVISSSQSVTVNAVPVATSIALSADNSILSYYDSDTATLSALVKDQNGAVMSGESVVFKQGSITLGTVQTGSDGVAEYTYASQGIGDTGFTAEVGSLVSETYSVEDCIFYHGDAISYTGTSTSDTVYSLGYDEIADLSSTDFEFSWKFHQTQRGADVCLGASSEFSVSPVKSNYRVYLGGNDSGVGRYGYRTTSSSTSTSGAVSANTVYDMKITRNSDTFNYYLDNTLLGSKTASFFSNYNMFGIHTVQWNKGTTTISEIKIKPL